MTASALDTFGCFFQGKFIFDNDIDKKRAKDMGIENFNKKYELAEIVTGDSNFCATGITNSEIVKGVELKDNFFITETLITHKSSNFKKVCKIIHNI